MSGRYFAAGCTIFITNGRASRDKETGQPAATLLEVMSPPATSSTNALHRYAGSLGDADIVTKTPGVRRGWRMSAMEADIASQHAHVCFGSKADIGRRSSNVRFWPGKDIPGTDRNPEAHPQSASLIANLRPDRKNSRCAGSRQLSAVGSTSGVRARSRSIMIFASSNWPRCA